MKKYIFVLLLMLMTIVKKSQSQVNIDSIMKADVEFNSTHSSPNTNNGKYYTIRGFQMYVKTYGEGAPLLLIHGNGNSIKGYNRNIMYLENKFKVIVPDCRNYGNSIDKGDSLSDEMIADDLKELLVQMDIKTTYVVGSSSGGNTALWLASKYPTLVKKMVINGVNLTTDAETIGEFWNKHHKNILDSLSAIANKTEVDKKLLKNIKREYNNMTYSDLKKIICPSLVIAGDHDLVTIKHTNQIFENITNAYLWILPAAGHNVNKFYSNEYLNQVVYFLNTPFKPFTNNDRRY